MADPTTSKDTRSPHPSQLSPSLPGPTVYITGHNASSQAHVAAARPLEYAPFDNKNMGMAVCYSNDANADLNADADLAAHDSLLASQTLGLVKPGGTVCRQVDFAPGYTCTMHRTASLDFGVVLEGELDMLLDGGSVTRLRRGDVAVQRATNHAWRNPSETEWTRVLFVLQDIAPLTVGGERVVEGMAERPAELVESGN